MAKTATETRIASGKKQESKAQRMAGVVSRSMASPPTAPANGDQKPAPEPKSGDQKDAPTSKKKASEQVQKWRAQKKFDLTQVITVLATEKNPKRAKAAARFALYKSGMTVQQVIDAYKKAEYSAALAMADMRWDAVAGFISVK